MKLKDIQVIRLLLIFWDFGWNLTKLLQINSLYTCGIQSRDKWSRSNYIQVAIIEFIKLHELDTTSISRFPVDTRFLLKPWFPDIDFLSSSISTFSICIRFRFSCWFHLIDYPLVDLHLLDFPPFYLSSLLIYPFLRQHIMFKQYPLHG